MASDTNSTSRIHPMPAACRLLSIGRTKLYELIAQGDLLAIRIGARRFVSEAEIQRFLETRQQAAADELAERRKQRTFGEARAEQ